jgi:hypothetical protein
MDTARESTASIMCPFLGFLLTMGHTFNSITRHDAQWLTDWARIGHNGFITWCT